MTRDQRIVATGAFAGIVSMLVLLVVLTTMLSGLSADAPPGERLAFAVKWIALAALPLALAIASVGNARFNSDAIDPTAGKEGPPMIVNGRVVDNNVQQYLLFGSAALAVAAAARGDQLGVVAAAAITFVIARMALLDRLSYQAALSSRGLLLDLLSQHRDVCLRRMAGVALALTRCDASQNRRWRRRRDSNPRYSFPYDALAKRWFQPLTHVSGIRCARPFAGRAAMASAACSGPFRWVQPLTRNDLGDRTLVGHSLP